MDRYQDKAETASLGFKLRDERFSVERVSASWLKEGVNLDQRLNTGCALHQGVLLF